MTETTKTGMEHRLDRRPSAHEGCARRTARRGGALLTAAAIALAAGAIAQEAETGNAYDVPLFESASAGRARQGFIRIENLSANGGDVAITAFEDDGTEHGPTSLTIGRGRTVHLNATDLEQGNPAKGVEGIGDTPAAGRWRLKLESELDLRILSYMRTSDGFLTGLERTRRVDECAHRIHTFNPGRNRQKVSMLRIVNPGDEAVRVHIAGTDDAAAASAGTVWVSLEPGTAKQLTAQELESGEAEGLEGALGEGSGKWRLAIRGTGPVEIMNLLQSPTGHVTTLAGEGTTGETDSQSRVISLRQHGDSIVIAKIASCIDRSELDFGHIAHQVIERYGDHFDFMFISANLENVRDNHRYRYYGAFYRTQNQVQGTGLHTGTYTPYDEIYGEGVRGRLKGLIHFPYQYGLTRGPGLHEILHAWANYAISPGKPHWGFSSANGQLGGFDIDDLVHRGNDEYTAGRFGTFANGGNSVPYSPIELYFAGWITPEEVPDLQVAKDAQWVRENGVFKRSEEGYYVFRTSGWERWSIERIVAMHGPRKPDHSNAQRKFRGAFLLLVDDLHLAETEVLTTLEEQLDAFARKSDDGTALYNFWEATRGQASLKLDGLGALKPAVPAIAQRSKAAEPDAVRRETVEDGHAHEHLEGEETSQEGPDGEEMWSASEQ